LPSRGRAWHQVIGVAVVEVEIEKEIRCAFEVRALEELLAGDHVCEYGLAAPRIASVEQCRPYLEHRCSSLIRPNDAARLPASHIEIDAGEVVQLVAERDRIAHIDRAEPYVRFQATGEPCVAPSEDPLAQTRRKAPKRDLLQTGASRAALLSEPKQAVLRKEAIEVEHLVR